MAGVGSMWWRGQVQGGCKSGLASRKGLSKKAICSGHFLWAGEAGAKRQHPTLPSQARQGPPKPAPPRTITPGPPARPH